MYEWARTWKRPFNDSKRLAINFFKVAPVVQYYKLVTTCLAWTENTKYLGVMLQSYPTFNLYIAGRSIKSNKLLGGIKHLMHNAPKKLSC